MPDPFNVFSEYAILCVGGELLSSITGDYIEMVAEMNIVGAVSSCPYDLNGFGRPTSVRAEVGLYGGEFS